jgi:hypothetical protein
MRLTLAIPTMVALAAACVAGCGSKPSAGAREQGHSAAVSSPAGGGRPTSAARRLMGLPTLPPNSPLPGYLLIADRDNNRLIVVSPTKRILWRFPSDGDLRPGQAFAGPDDAFLTPSGRGIITNEEFSDALAVIRLGRRPRIAFQYGRNNVPGSRPGYLSHPDDAYQLRNGLISVADIINCRVLFIRPGQGIARSIGQAGDCVHDPPKSLSQPNGDTPLPDGGVLVTEIGGWVDRFDRRGKLQWTIRTPTSYPSDAQLLPNGDVLVAGFDDPGQIYVLTRRGKVVWRYGPPSGAGALNKPSLALPLSGRLIGATDDYGQRVVVIDRRKKRIVWQYGHLDQPGSAPGYLNKPDGLDLIR